MRKCTSRAQWVLGTEPKFSSVVVVTVIAGIGGKLVKEGGW